MKRTIWFALFLLLVGAAPGFAADGTLPGGTSISVDITAPPDGAVKVFPPGVATLTGTAAVGTGVPLANTAIIYVIDTSGSTGASAGVDCTGDGVDDTILTCEQRAALNLNAIATTTSTVVAVAVVSFDSTGAVAQPFTDPSNPAVAAAINALAPWNAHGLRRGPRHRRRPAAASGRHHEHDLVFMSDGLHNTAPASPPSPFPARSRSRRSRSAPRRTARAAARTA